MCCKLPGLAELAKPVGQWCQFIARPIGTGCGCYDSRPQTCRTFACGWLQGEGTDALRPDRSRVVLTTPSNGVPVLLVDAQYPDAWHQGAGGRWVAARLRAGEAVITVTGSQPPHLHTPDGTGRVRSTRLEAVPTTETPA